MKKILFVLFTLLNIVSCATAQNKDRQSSINTIFSNMELDGIDTKQPMLYGYFFFDKDKSKLENLKSELLKQNYKLVRLEKIKALEYILHVEKVEVHSRASLLERENQLDMLAQKYKVENYDGWDVGNADPSKPLVSNTNFEQSLNDKSDAELYSLADGFYNNDTFDKAIIVFQKCIDRNYKLDTSYYKQGVSYLSLEAYPTGIKMLEEALKLNPGYFKACFNMYAFYEPRPFYAGLV